MARSDVDYLGHLLTREGIKPLNKNVEAVLKYPPPKTVEELRRFQGMAGYYRRFVMGYAHVAEPLTSLTKKSVAYEWSRACQSALDEIKNALIIPRLAYPDWKKPFNLYTDASNVGLDAILSQDQEGREVNIAYLSRTLDKHERNYTITEKEMLAVIWSVKKLRPYLWGREFQIITDHQALHTPHQPERPYRQAGKVGHDSAD